MITSPDAALVSFCHSVDADFRQDYLKIAFLWHDAIIFEELGDYNVDRFLDHETEGETLNTNHRASLSDVIIPLSSRLEQDALDAWKMSKLIGYPRWGENYEHYDYPEPENPFEFAHNELLRALEREHGVARFIDGYDIEQAEGRSRVAVESVQLWNLVNSIQPCLLLANTDEELALSAAASFGVEAASAPSASELFEASIPSMTKVPWSKIIDLKSKGTLIALRKKIDDIFEQGKGDIGAGHQFLLETEQQIVDEIVEAYRPKMLRTSIKNIASNIPGLLINPVGAYVGAKEIFNEAQKAKNLSWFYALRDIRSLPNE